VAEGVETPQQLEVVMGLGFDSAQGYLLQRPAPGLNAVTLDLPALAGHPGGGHPIPAPTRAGA
jgi:EAL domain-containing protein (putative c-di-GMP-specific phosphodiesterase class I)